MLNKIAEKLPNTIFIETSNNCHLSCYMCTRKVMNRKIGTMSWDLYKKIIDELSDKISSKNERKETKLLLFGQGEPLINNNIFKMIEYAKKSDFKVEITTNGLLLNDKNITKLIESKIDAVYISWYGFDKKTYENIHGRDFYDTFISNVINFIHAINNKENNIELICYWMNSTYNVDDQEFASWLFSYISVDKARGHRIRNYRNLFESIGIKQDRDYVFEKLKKMKINDPKDNLVGAHCLWNNMYIHWDGNIYPCQIDYNGEYLVGNVDNDGVLDVWNNDKFQNFRECILSGDYSEINNCKFCNECSIAVPKSMIKEEVDYSKYFIFNEHSYRYGKYQWFKKNFPKEKPERWQMKLDELKLNWKGIKEEREKLMLKDIIDFAKSKENIVIVGDEIHTYYLCKFLTDKCPDVLKKISKIYNGYPVKTNLKSEIIKNSECNIIISSYYYEKTILKELENNKFKNEVLPLYLENVFPVFYQMYFEDDIRI